MCTQMKEPAWQDGGQCSSGYRSRHSSPRPPAVTGPPGPLSPDAAVRGSCGPSTAQCRTAVPSRCPCRAQGPPFSTRTVEFFN